jgi:hypothetical protein
MPALLILALFLPTVLDAWTISSFESDIAIEPDGNVLVAETIQVDFADE